MTAVHTTTLIKTVLSCSGHTPAGATYTGRIITTLSMATVKAALSNMKPAMVSDLKSISPTIQLTLFHATDTM